MDISRNQKIACGIWIGVAALTTGIVHRYPRYLNYETNIKGVALASAVNGLVLSSVHTLINYCLRPKGLETLKKEWKDKRIKLLEKGIQYEIAMSEVFELEETNSRRLNEQKQNITDKEAIISRKRDVLTSLKDQRDSKKERSFE